MFLLPAGIILAGASQTSPSSPAEILIEGAIRIGYSVRLPQPDRGREKDLYRRLPGLVKELGTRDREVGTGPASARPRRASAAVPALEHPPGSTRGGRIC